MLSKKTLKLLLTENVDNLGIVGDIVEVKPGYARNFLLPHGLAAEPTQGNIDAVQERRAQVERELRELRAQQEKLISRLEEFELTMERSANEQGVLFGSVSQHDIAVALQEEGFNIAEREVRIGSQIKQLDSYMIPVQLSPELKTEIKLWVVSDKPAEQLEAEADEGEEAEREQAQAE
ncbi:MAG: 50S ribosomal protein L9 [Phycisphaeraceae bacterium]